MFFLFLNIFFFSSPSFFVNFSYVTFFPLAGIGQLWPHWPFDLSLHNYLTLNLYNITSFLCIICDDAYGNKQWMNRLCTTCTYYKYRHDRVVKNTYVSTHYIYHLTSFPMHKLIICSACHRVVISVQIKWSSGRPKLPSDDLNFTAGHPWDDQTYFPWTWVWLWEPFPPVLKCINLQNRLFPTLVFTL